MKNLIIILTLFVTSSLFSNNIAIKLLEQSYKKLNQEIIECQNEEKRIFKNNSNLEDHLTLRKKIKELYKTRQELKEMLLQVINDYEKKNEQNNNNNIATTEEPTAQSNNEKDATPVKTEKNQAPPRHEHNSSDQQNADNIIQANHVPIKEELTIAVPKTVKPGEIFSYLIKPPKHYKQPKIKWIRYESNLDTPNGIPPTVFSGKFVPDADIERQQNTWIAAYVVDLANPGSGVKGKVNFTISGETVEEKMGLKVPSKMISGRKASFTIQVPPGFKRPYSVLVKSFGGKHLIVNWSTTSLTGTLRAWGDGNRDNILTAGISARVYDDTGRIGYVRKNITIVEPTQEDLDEIPMEKPPAWYEKAADFAWKATKETGKVTLATLEGAGKAMKTISEGAQNKNVYYSGNNNNHPIHDHIPGTWLVNCHSAETEPGNWQMKITLFSPKGNELHGRAVGSNGSGTWDYDAYFNRIEITGLFNFIANDKKKHHFTAYGTVIRNKIIQGYADDDKSDYNVKWSAKKIK